MSLIPDAGLLFGSEGLNTTPPYEDADIASLFRWFSGDHVLAVGLIATVVGASLTLAGVLPRVVVPATAMLQISLADHIDFWTIGAESVLRILGLILAVFSLLTPSAFHGSFRGVQGSAVPAWPLRLIRFQIVVIYASTAIEKLRGSEWRDGSAVYHALEIEHLRRFEPPMLLTDVEPVVKVLTYMALATELSLPVLLLWRRTRRLAVLLAIGLHAGFDIFLELGFFGPAMVAGVLAFTDPADARRLLRWHPAKPGEPASEPEGDAHTASVTRSSMELLRYSTGR